MKDLLERIADALERIANALEQRANGEHEVESAPDDPAPPPPPQRAGELIAFLARRDVKLRDDAPPTPQTDEGQGEMDALAWLIGERWANVRLLVEAVKARLGNGEGFALNLRGQPETAISDICAVAHRAHSLGLLEQYRYRRSPAFRLEARPSRSPLSQRFWTGGWLERWARQHLLRVAAQLHPDAPISWLANLPVILPSGEGFEIDLIAQVGDRVIWVEAKSADYQDSLDKYGRIRRILGLPQHSALVLLADPRAPHRPLSALYALTVCGLEDFPARCAAALGAAGEENEKRPA
jgi:hypothetical protein